MIRAGAPLWVFLTLMVIGRAQPAAERAPSEQAPIVNFRLPTFTKEGNRGMLVRGSEARIDAKRRINIRELTMTVFRGDPAGTIETILLSPSADLDPDAQVATGESSIRVINDEFEASGSGWRYERETKRISIARDVRVTFKAELTDLLQ